MILVGIINKNRGRDFSPSPSLLWPDSGGADNFLNFLEKELIPHIDTNYPTASYKMLIGHSLGGTFTVYSMIHSPELFNSYILIDPNICWDNNFLFNQWEKLSKKIDLSNEQVYLSYTYWDKTLDSMKIKNDTTENTECMKTKFEFYDVLDSLETINIKSRFYTNETHSSLSLISIYDGLNYIFNYFKPPVIHNNIDSVKNAKDLIQDHYDMVSNRIGFKVWPSDDLIDGVLYLYLINNMSDQKNEILKLKKIK